MEFFLRGSLPYHIGDLEIGAGVGYVLTHSMYRPLCQRSHDEDVIVGIVVFQVAVQVLTGDVGEKHRFSLRIQSLQLFLYPFSAFVEVGEVGIAVFAHAHQHDAILIADEVFLAKIAVQELKVVVQIICFRSEYDAVLDGSSVTTGAV